MKPIEAAILSLISENDGEWGWYQLDRGLTMKNFDYEPDLLEMIGKLEEMGFMRSERIEGIPQARYWITDKGRQLLKEGVGSKNSSQR